MNNEQSTDAAKVKYASHTRQIIIYFKKFMRLVISEKQWFMIVMAGIIAAIVSYVVGANMFRTMEGTFLGAFAMACVSLWNGLFNSIQVVCKERAIIKREHRTGLSVFSYLMAHMSTQAIICLLQTIVTIIVLGCFNVRIIFNGVGTPYFLVDLFISLFLMTYAADMMGLMVSCVVKNTTMAMTAMPFVLIVQLVFSGGAFSLSGFSEKISNFTLTKWGMSALCISADYNALPSTTIYNQLRKVANKQPVLKDALDNIGRDALTKYFAQYSLKPAYNPIPSELYLIWGRFILFIAVFALVGLISLAFIDKDKR